MNITPSPTEQNGKTQNGLKFHSWMIASFLLEDLPAQHTSLPVPFYNAVYHNPKATIDPLMLASMHFIVHVHHPDAH